MKGEEQKLGILGEILKEKMNEKDLNERQLVRQVNKNTLMTGDIYGLTMAGLRTYMLAGIDRDSFILNHLRRIAAIFNILGLSMEDVIRTMDRIDVES